jgi:iron complex outermembrane receptor protein
MGYHRDGFPASGARVLADGGHGLQAGFRADFGPADSQVTVQGDVFDHRSGGAGEGGDKGWNLLGRWRGTASEGSVTEAQAYYSRFSRRFSGVFDRLEMGDLSLQHNRTEGAHSLVVGGGVRMNRDRFVNGANFFQLVPASRTLWIVNAFAQDRVDLGGGVAATVGVKLEKTTFTGVEVLPSVRLAWKPADDHLLYASAARAVREPSRVDRDLEAPGFLEPGTFRAEQLTALELGYRGQPARNASLHLAVFYNLYDDLRTTQFTPSAILPVRLANGIKGTSWGIEAWGQVQVAPWWRLNAGFTTLDKDFRLKPGENDLENFISLGNDAGFIGQLGSRLDLGPDVGLDLQLRHYGSRPRPAVPAYTDVDARLGWRVTSAVELYVSGINLLHDRRRESEDRSRGQLVQRMVTLGARFRL